MINEFGKLFDIFLSQDFLYLIIGFVSFIILAYFTIEFMSIIFRIGSVIISFMDKFILTKIMIPTFVIVSMMILLFLFIKTLEILTIITK